MPKNVDKIAMGLALALLGYLGYSVVDTGAALVSQGKEPPGITQTMLRPELVAAQNHGSPAGRDPFEVAWASYLSGNKAAAPAGRGQAPLPAEDPDFASEDEDADAAQMQEEGEPGTAAPHAGPPAAKAEPKPPPAPPPLSAQLTGVCVGDQGRMAIIDQRVYCVGDAVKGPDAAAAWVVESIENEHVVLKCGDVQQTLRITRPGAAEHAEKKADGKP
jgi:hypothetical protein